VSLEGDLGRLGNGATNSDVATVVSQDFEIENVVLKTFDLGLEKVASSRIVEEAEINENRGGGVAL
jgi:hypothetical protein